MSDDDDFDDGSGSKAVSGENTQIEVYGRIRPSAKNDASVCNLSDGTTRSGGRKGARGWSIPVLSLLCAASTDTITGSPLTPLARTAVTLFSRLCADHRHIEFRLPRDASGGYVNNKREQYEFHMSHIFDESTTQEQIFEGIGKKVVNNVLEGFNGARGSTSSAVQWRAGVAQQTRHSPLTHFIFVSCAVQAR